MNTEIKVSLNNTKTTEARIALWVDQQRVITIEDWYVDAQTNELVIIPQTDLFDYSELPVALKHITKVFEAQAKFEAAV